MWLTAQTGHQADPKTVQLAITLLGDYQKSPERQAARNQARQANATAMAERKAATEKKAAERKKKLEEQLAAIQTNSESNFPKQFYNPLAAFSQSGECD